MSSGEYFNVFVIIDVEEVENAVLDKLFGSQIGETTLLGQNITDIHLGKKTEHPFFPDDQVDPVVALLAVQGDASQPLPLLLQDLDLYMPVVDHATALADKILQVTDLRGRGRLDYLFYDDGLTRSA